MIIFFNKMVLNKIHITVFDKLVIIVIHGDPQGGRIDCFSENDAFGLIMIAVESMILSCGQFIHQDYDQFFQ